MVPGAILPPAGWGLRHHREDRGGRGLGGDRKLRVANMAAKVSAFMARVPTAPHSTPSGRDRWNTPHF